MSRVNISKTLSTKSQLVLNRRIFCNIPADKDDHERGPSSAKCLWQIDFAVCFVSLLNLQAIAEVRQLEYIVFRNKIIKENVIMIPNEEEHQFYLSYVIIEGQSKILHIVTREIINYTFYEEHYQTYQVHKSATNSSND